MKCGWKYKCEFKLNNNCTNLEWCNHKLKSHVKTEKMHIKGLQKHMLNWRKRKKLPTNKKQVWYVLPILSEEVGELCETITKGRGDTAEEIADVILTAISIACVLDINVEKAISDKLKDIEKKQPFKIGEHTRVMKP